MENSARTHRLWALLVATCLGVVLLQVPPVFASPEETDGMEEQVVNPHFSQGTTGWRTNGANQNLNVLDGDVAELRTRERGHAVLNDLRNTVQGADKGTTYTVSARVRTTTPNVYGALRIREVDRGKVAVSQSTFALRSTAWQTIDLDLRTIYDGSHLDLNVVAWNLAPEKNLQIDSVSLREVPEPRGTDEQESGAPDQCRADPPVGTLYGSSISTRGQTLEQAVHRIDETFGRVAVIRHFRPGLPLPWNSRNMQLMGDRTLVTSFKAHPSEITSGSLDSFFRDWFATVPEDQTIYWSYFHEPEDNIAAGEFTKSQYRDAWKRLARLEQEACKPNLHATLILTEWTMRAASKRDFRTYDAGPEYVKVLAFDPYNGASDPTRDYYQSAENLLGQIVTAMEADGRPWGIAEIGSQQIASDSDGHGRAEWLTEMAEYAEAHDALFVAYYHSGDNGFNFRLDEENANRVWRDLVAK